MKEKEKKERIPQENEKNTRNQPTEQKFHQWENTLAVPIVIYSGLFLK